MPIKHTVRYLTVPSTAASGVDTAATMPRTDTSSTAVSAAASTMKSVTVLPTHSAARCLSPAPTD